MMRIFLLIILLLSSNVFSDELEDAYKKEYAYLVAEKKALEQRLANLKASQNSTLKKLDTEIEALQQQFLSRQNQTDRLNNQIVAASRGVDVGDNDRVLLETTLIQAEESLDKYGQTIDDSLAQDEQLAKAFSLASHVMNEDDQIRTSEGQYFALTGEAIDGEIIHIGRIAKYGLSASAGGALAPSGGGLFKLWEADAGQTAALIKQNQAPETVGVFLFDDVSKSFEKTEEKTFEEELKAGGIIAKVILALGVLGLLLVVVRAVFLFLFSANIQSMTQRVGQLVAKGELERALDVCKRQFNSVSKVISSALRNLDKDRDHIEDIVSESILNESSKIDRFGSVILVIAAVSPLLGLLGTVTGMIGTFDIITEFGTGDPKLLSSGISEALITTKYGLIVAIPLLLLGNVLSGWGLRTKNHLEQAALHMINTYKK
ncbi:MAG TPA: flagellar motor protein MotA [Gammaproteobacteria bacterium]|nr:flagellar motor protein MotA [Gammaproteobacteria bacterium]